MSVHPKWPSRAIKAGVVLYLLYLFLLCFTTDSQLGRIFFATLPTLFGIIGFVFAMLMPYAILFVVLLPILLSFGFYAIWQAQIVPILSAVDGPTIAILNVVITYIIYVILYLFIPHKPEHYHEPAPKSNSHSIHHESKQIDVEPRVIVKEVPVIDSAQQEHIAALSSENDKYRTILSQYQHQAEYSKNEQQRLHQLATNYEKVIQDYALKLQQQQLELNDVKNLAYHATQTSKDSLKTIKKLSSELLDAKASLQINQDNFITNIRSIEDKCKAINFVIGRVYSDKNGGSETLRKKLRIDRDLYNLFSSITQSFNPKYAPQLYTVLEAVKLRLTSFHFIEAKVFDARIYSRGLSSTEDKSILEWLGLKDQDPIKEYHAEALTICTNMQNYLKEKKYV